MSIKQTRIFGYDLIKTIAIFLVVYYHLGGIDFGTIQTEGFYLPNINKLLSVFCAAGVPLFFMVNGALMTPKNLSLEQTIARSFHLLFILFFWKVILQYVICQRLLGIYDNMSHFWFLGTLSIVYIISYFFKYYKPIKIIIVSLLLIHPFLSNFLLDFVVLFSPSSKPLFWNHSGFFTLYAILYFSIGSWFGDKRLSPIFSFGLFILGFLLINFEVIVLSNYFHTIYDGVNSSFPTFGALLLSLGIFMLLKDVSAKKLLLNYSVTFVGKNTMGIYLFHVLFIFLLRHYLDIGVDHISLLMSVGLSLIIALISGFIGNLLSNSYFYFLLHFTRRNL